ncbi:NADPH HC-toxin reductase 1-like [Silene latifolia]|uniref:NADPH HC-toxin reductase 1-like n=1 Tax=Silene latifolia TaxID=37657 RepID=UPI003D772C6C
MRLQYGIRSITGRLEVYDHLYGEQTHRFIQVHYILTVRPLYLKAVAVCIIIQFKDTTEAAVAGVKSIAMSCIKSGTVKRLIYTASCVSASTFNIDSTSLAEFMDESCWTSPDMPLSFAHEFEKAYALSKTASEREVLKFGESGNLEVVSLVCGVVGGETLLPYVPVSLAVCVSQLKDEESIAFGQLRFTEEICGKIPVIHIEDTCDAHIFCIEKDSINGRFLCASDFVSSADIAAYYTQKFPELSVKQE